MPRRTRLQLERFLPYRLVTLAQRLSTALSTIYREQFDITIAEWRILAHLANKGELNPTEIALQTSMDKARVTRAIKQLDARRCLLRRRQRGDRRAYRLRLSAQGLALYRRIEPLALAWEEELLRALDTAEHKSLLRIIDKLAARAERMGNGAAGTDD